MTIHQTSMMRGMGIDGVKSSIKSYSCDSVSYGGAGGSRRPDIKIIDRPCGTGKTTEILRSFKLGQRYLVVVPLLSEVERVINDASVLFFQPQPSHGHATKAAHLDELLDRGVNIVTTHALFTDIAQAAASGRLDDYHIIIDEVLDVVEPARGKSPRSFQEFYLDDGYATVLEDGLVLPTRRWDDDHKLVADTLDLGLYHLAKSGTLHWVDGSFFIWALPVALLRCGRSFTVYTYLAEGSLMLAYLRKRGIEFVHERYADEASFRMLARQLIDVRPLPALKDVTFTYTGQTRVDGMSRRAEKVATALKNLKQRQLKGVDVRDVIITSAKRNWYRDENESRAGAFASGSRMFGANWLPNTTRGTNDYAHAQVAIYLYDQYLNPYLKRWLGLASDKGADDRYALTELVQWVYRSRVRRGEQITLYLPSDRMRRILEGWLNR